MHIGRFLLCLHSHMPYVLSHGRSPHGTDWLNESAAECYLPLLDVLRRLEEEDISPRWTVNLTPVLAEQLDDPGFAEGFEAYCLEKRDAAEADIERFMAEGALGMLGVANMWRRFYEQARERFVHTWNRSICGGFAHFQKTGRIEIITCCATHGYLPLLGTDESVDAQVKLGVDSYRRRFGQAPRGIWLPECAYRPGYEWKSPVGEEETPWFREGVDSFLAAHGLEYFFVDSHMIRGGQPLGTYGTRFPQLAEMFARSAKSFTPPETERSEYEHYALRSGLACMARDPETTVRVWSGDVGYPGSPEYLEFHKQLYPGRLRYWRISENKADLGAKQPYQPWEAFSRISEHAADFARVVKETLARYKGDAGRTGTLVAMYDTELFGHWWWEGPEFLYETARQMHYDGQVQLVSGSDLLEREPPAGVIDLPEGSWGEGGYHYIWLNEHNAWTWERLYPAERKLRELVREPCGPNAERTLLQAARELLLAEASDWQFLISTWAARDYAELRFEDHIERFWRLVAIAEEQATGTATDAASLEFLADCEQKDAPFPYLDLSYWQPAEQPAGKGRL